MANQTIIPAGILREFSKEVLTAGRGDELPQLLEKLQRKYEKGRPCDYRLQCVEHSRCPENPVCNN
jgi:hypothetical protein